MSKADTSKAKAPGKNPPRKKSAAAKPKAAPPAKEKKLSKKTIKALMIAGIVFIAVIAAGTSYYFKAGGPEGNEKPQIVEEVQKNPLPESVQLLLDQGLLKDALDALGPAVDSDPENIELLLASARLHVKGACYSAAKKLAERALEIDENRGLAHAVVGLALFQDAQFEEALKKSLYAIKLDDKESLGYLTVGKIYLRQNGLKDALAVLKQAARLDPKNLLSGRNCRQFTLNKKSSNEDCWQGKRRWKPTRIILRRTLICPLCISGKKIYQRPLSTSKKQKPCTGQMPTNTGWEKHATRRSCI